MCSQNSVMHVSFFLHLLSFTVYCTDCMWKPFTNIFLQLRVINNFSIHAIMHISKIWYTYLYICTNWYSWKLWYLTWPLPHSTAWAKTKLDLSWHNVLYNADKVQCTNICTKLKANYNVFKFQTSHHLPPPKCLCCNTDSYKLLTNFCVPEMEWTVMAISPLHHQRVPNPVSLPCVEQCNKCVITSEN